MAISLDEFKSKPSGTMTATERGNFASFGFWESPQAQTIAPIVYDAVGAYTDILSVYGMHFNSVKGSP